MVRGVHSDLAALIYCHSSSSYSLKLNYRLILDLVLLLYFSRLLLLLFFFFFPFLINIFLNLFKIT